MEERPLSIAWRERLAPNAKLDYQTCQSGEDPAAWMEKHGFEQQAIRVKRFFIPSYHIGIEDFPKCFYEILGDPCAYSTDENYIAQSQYDRWLGEGVYKLWLNNVKDLDMDRDGHVESS
jgi:hypothetical protein